MLDFKLDPTRFVAGALGLAALVALSTPARAGFTNGEARAEPAIDLPIAGWRLSAPLFIGTRFESVSPFPADITGYTDNRSTSVARSEVLVEVGRHPR
jgi:hypothetical protein